mmetsp:Transcript_9567/g.28915  ORF Transcript_9567/g.28915 Transcript_9567/m.28915 type:complete len:372 (+) Transcript_9567:179-1294(+)
MDDVSEGMEITDEELLEALREILTEADLEKTSVRVVMGQLGERFAGIDLQARKPYVKKMIPVLIEEIEESRGRDEEEEEEEEEEEKENDAEGHGAEEEESERRKDANQGREGRGEENVEEEVEEEVVEEEMDDEEEDSEAQPSRKGKRKRTKLTAFEKAVVLREPLADVLGTRVVSRCKIPQFVKQYIAEHNLQKNPKDRREYICDSPLKKVLKTKTFTMFSINKYIAPLVMKADECDKATKKEIEQYEAAAVEALADAPDESDDDSRPQKKRKKQSKGGKNSGGEGNRGGGLKIPMQLSQELADVCKAKVLPRTEVVKAIWAYIRENDLKDPEDGRKVICDEKLRKICDGEEKIGIFAINKFITKHLTKL